jgi:hypothetical protein
MGEVLGLFGMALVILAGVLVMGVIIQARHRRDEQARLAAAQRAARERREAPRRVQQEIDDIDAIIRRVDKADTAEELDLIRRWYGHDNS